jgi:glycerol uptake facilitator-like aquaporin
MQSTHNLTYFPNNRILIPVLNMEPRSQFAELYGTFTCVFAYTASNADPVATGTGLLVAFTLTGIISGGHFNPAVTVGYIITRLLSKLATRNEILKYLLYIVM